MKVELKIAVEIDIDKEKYPNVTTKTVYDGIYISESDICHGFEISTSVAGCDCANDFFLKNAVLLGKRLLGNNKMLAENSHPKLIGHFNGRNKCLHSVEDVARFICTDGMRGDVSVTYDDGRPFLDTCYIYLKNIADKTYREELLKVLTPMQIKIENKEKNSMNEYEHLRRLAEINKEKYPAGTRILLNNMDDPLDPVPSGTRGTVDSVDGAGQIFMKWDNGRTLPLNSDVDSFRKLSDEEIAEEQADGEDMDEDNGPVMGM